MKPTIILVVFSALIAGITAETDSCTAHVSEACMAPGTNWESGACRSIYGGFRGNAKNLKLLAASHIQDSFKYLIMVKLLNKVIYEKKKKKYGRLRKELSRNLS